MMDVIPWDAQEEIKEPAAKTTPEKEPTKFQKLTTRSEAMFKLEEEDNTSR
jgi:hypothetical protein